MRTFITGYDGEKIVEFGNRDMGKIQRLCSHLDNLMSRIDLSVAKRQRRAMRKASYRIREKIQSLVKDLRMESCTVFSKRIQSYLFAYFFYIFHGSQVWPQTK
ncbi:hypothetical protein [Okeania sp. SIO3B5]|uniref:hypothetical protein n=1 Tax=Okeania sp. SIO3B5 TaxID=2607811 RepID=UPI0025CDAFF2|nr:hypothetical protein [Okeania sp. SIO3B5]